MPDQHEGRAAHVVEGSVSIGDDHHEAGRMPVVHPHSDLALRAGPAGARLFLLGGAAMDGPPPPKLLVSG